jgi:hypothetical protein
MFQQLTLVLKTCLSTWIRGKKRTLGNDIDGFIIAFTGKGFECEEGSEADGQGGVSGVVQESLRERGERRWVFDGHACKKGRDSQKAA